MTERPELLDEAAALAARAASPPRQAAAAHVGRDVVHAMLLARASVDRAKPTGRFVWAKDVVLRVSKVFLRDQASFNRAAVVAIDDLSARVERLEAEIAQRGGDADRARQA